MDDLTTQFKRKPKQVHPIRGGASNGASTPFKLATTTGVLLTLGALFYVWTAFGGTEILFTKNITRDTAAALLYSDSDLTNGLILHYTFDEEDLVTNVVDNSGQGNTGYLTNFTSTTTVVGRVGGALDFDGTDDYIATGEVYNVASPVTINVWTNFNYLGFADSHTIISNRVASNDGFTAQIRGGAGTGCDETSDFRFVIQGVAAYESADEFKRSFCGWHMVTFVFTGSRVDYYYDGAFLDSDTTGSMTTGGDVVVGVTGAALTSNLFGQDANTTVAYMDDLRMYNRALSAAEIERLYSLNRRTNQNTTLTSPNLKTGLVGHWTFDGKDLINNAADSSGNGNTGYLNGFTSTTTTTGKLGQALEFDGVDDHVSNSNSSTFNLETNSVSVWFKTTGSGFARIVTKLNQSSTRMPFEIRRNTNNTIQYTIFNGTAVAVNSDTTLNDGQWHHAVGTRVKGGALKLYIDGVLQSDQKTDTLGDTTVSSDLSIGAREDGANPFDGTIDDVRIYNRVLSADEITHLYGLGATTHVNTTITSPNLQTGLVGHWTFDGKDLINNAADRSGQGNTGYLTNFTSTTTVIGRLGQALDFDGSDDYVSVPHSFGSVLPATFTAWVKPTAACDNYDQIIGQTVSGLLTHSNGTCELRYNWNNVSTTFNWSSGVNLSLNEWAFVALRVTSDNAVIFKGNAGVIASSTNSISHTSETFSALNIGRDSDNVGFFTGGIDDVRVYTRALSDDEISRLYELGR